VACLDVSALVNWPVAQAFPWHAPSLATDPAPIRTCKSVEIEATAGKIPFDQHEGEGEALAALTALKAAKHRTRPSGCRSKVAKVVLFMVEPQTTKPRSEMMTPIPAIDKKVICAAWERCVTVCILGVFAAGD
jgi:hypothetical protein